MSEPKKPKEADYVANYKRKCIVCRQSPIVDIYPKDGSRKESTDMCGVCTWGDSECSDPDNW